MTNEREALPLVAMPRADRESRVERVAAPRAGTECHVAAVGRDARLWVVATQAQPVRPAKSDDDPARRRHADRDRHPGSGEGRLPAGRRAPSG